MCCMTVHCNLCSALDEDEDNDDMDEQDKAAEVGVPIVHIYLSVVNM